MYKRILISIDGSETSNKALDAALQLAREIGAQALLFHAVDELAYVSAYEYTGEVLAITRENAAKVLSDGMARAQAAGVPAEQRLVDSAGTRLSESVANAARDWQADLIVVGTHGRRGIGRVLLGSGAEQIIRDAPLPVLVIRGEESAPKAA